MSCYHPRPTFESIDGSTGEVRTTLWRPPGGLFFVRKSYMTKCGQCFGCRDAYVREWSQRCEHEALFHKENSFITLTVNDDFIEEVFPGGSLRYEPFQDFIRAFRKKIKRKVRFFMCGEYGEKLSRPHYHAVIFGWFPSEEDRLIYKKTAVGSLFTSKVLGSVWKFGFHTVGEFSAATAAYVAGYMQKKINGKLKSKWYGDLMPEFAHASNGGGKKGDVKNGGLGHRYYKEFARDIYHGYDGIVSKGGMVLPSPRYYDKLHSFYHPVHAGVVKARRVVRIQSLAPDSQSSHLEAIRALKSREVNHRARRKRAMGRNNF